MVPNTPGLASGKNAHQLKSPVLSKRLTFLRAGQFISFGRMTGLTLSYRLFMGIGCLVGTWPYFIGPNVAVPGHQAIDSTLILAIHWGGGADEIITRINRRAARQQRHCLGRAAIISQSRQQ